MVLYVEQRWPGQYHNPARWDTVDGYMPFPVFRLYAEALWPTFALERLNLSAAIGLALAGKDAAERLHRSTVAEAYPGA